MDESTTLDVLDPAAGAAGMGSSLFFLVVRPQAKQRSSERAFYMSRHRQGNAGSQHGAIDSDVNGFSSSL
ncbi:MAG: hypothetical protein ACQEUM_04860 [Pseudomonadota bacterium]